MTSTTTPATTRQAMRLRLAAERSEEQAAAYRHMATLLATDPKLASIVEYERERLVRNACEFDADADNLIEQAMSIGFDR